MKTLWLFLTLVLMALPGHAAERPALVGVWKLLSYQTEFQDGSPSRALFGEHPTGYIIFTSEGRLMAVIEAEGRKAPSNDLDRAALLKTLIAYSGKYRIEGQQWITSVDTAERRGMARIGCVPFGFAAIGLRSHRPGWLP